MKKETRMPDRIESFRKVERRKNSAKSGFRVVKLPAIDWVK